MWKRGYTEPVYDLDGNFTGMRNPQTGDIEVEPLIDKKMNDANVASASMLPTTGDNNSEHGIMAGIMAIFAGALSMFGLGVDRKKKN